MKITTWNVNGLRAVLNKGLDETLENLQSDILMLQEIKAYRHQVVESHLQNLERHFPYAFWNPAQRPGYSGVLTLCRQKPEEVHYGLGLDEFDREGRLVLVKYPGFFVFNIYFPNGQHDLGRVPYKLDFYACLLAWCKQLHSEGRRLILGGDFNTAHQEIDLRNPKANQNTSGFLPEERVWIDHYLANGFVDIFRTLYPGRVQYTWWTYRMNARLRNIGWRLDYFLISRDLVSQVSDVITHEHILGSDHCPVSLDISEVEPGGSGG